MASRWLVVPSSHVWVQLYSWFVGNSLRISVAILHVLTTMVPDYTRMSNRFHFEHHHEKPFRGDGEGMICPTVRLAILYCDFHAESLVCHRAGKSERGHFELSKHTSRAPSAWSFKTTHRGKAIVLAGQWSSALKAFLWTHWRNDEKKRSKIVKVKPYNMHARYGTWWWPLWWSPRCKALI